MPMHRLAHIVALLAFSTIGLAQSESQAPPARSAAPPQAVPDRTLPIRRVVLYKTGVGYFEHLGRVRGNQEVAIRFTSSQLNDVLKSLTALDLGSGRIGGISYNSVAPLSQRLNALRLPLDQNATLKDLLATLRGANIEVSSPTAAATGRLLGVETRTQTNAIQASEVDYVSMLTAAGEMRTFEITPALRVRLLDSDLRQEVAQYLDLVGSTRQQDARRMVIQTLGNGDRDLLVSYVSEVPVWKSTYRLVVPKERGKPLLQGWAVVDNTIGEDWNGVTLSLVAGAPQSFVQQISQPFYTQRPVVPMPRNFLLTPQTHMATLTGGAGVIRGVVRDVSGSVLPGVRVVLRDGGREYTAVTNALGEYAVDAPAGVYRIEYQIQGFRTSIYDGVALTGGIERQQDVRMAVGAVEEAIRVSGIEQSARVQTGRGAGSGPGRGQLGGVVGGLPSPTPPPAPAAPPPPMLEAAAQALEMGDLFEYRITAPVTLARNQSALVPIVSAEVEMERVSVWNSGVSGGRPLRAMWLTNTSGLTLDGGSFSVVEGDAFAGEGLMEPLEPGERRLLSYAADLAVLVSARQGEMSGRMVRVRAHGGVFTQQSEERASMTYTLRNEDATPRVVVIEHPMRPGWKLAPGVTPAETSPAAYRFRVTVDPRKETTLDVNEIRVRDSTLAVSALSDDQLVFWRQSGIEVSKLEQILRPVLDKKAEAERRHNRLAQLEQTRQTIVNDQQRLRENMKALRGSDEERQLLRRYTTQLNEQEDKLAALEREMATEKAATEKANLEFSELINALTFDVSVPRS